MLIKGLKDVTYSEDGFTLQVLKQDEIKEVKEEIAHSLISRDCAVSTDIKESSLLESLDYNEKKALLKFIEEKENKKIELSDIKQITITNYLSELENIDELIKEYQNEGDSSN